MKEKKNKGITLIALVITIIVLLILAGVTLSTLFGNNGILTESKLAVESNKEANAKEQVQLAWTACETEYQSAWTKDSNIEKSTYFKKENLNKNLGTGTVKSVGYVENGKSTVTYTLDGTEYEFEITGGKIYSNGEAPEITLGTLTKNVVASNYGDTINYPVDLDNNPSTNDWKIFYNDGDNVFIIASDYLKHDKFPNIPTITLGTDDDDDFYWTEAVYNNSGAKGIDEYIAKKFELGWLFTGNHIESTNLNMKCIQDLMNTTYWNKFATGVDGAIAIGAPTVEMWINSRNQKYPSESIYYNAGGEYDSDSTIYDWSETADWGDSDGLKLSHDYGYQFFMKTEKWQKDMDNNSITDGKRYSSGVDRNTITLDNLYKVGTLSSPNSQYPEAICSINGETELGHNGSVYALYHGSGSAEQWQACKPCVCLPSDVNATKSGAVWNIEQ